MTASTRCSSVRGPATVPSLVTWPTSATQVRAGLRQPRPAGWPPRGPGRRCPPGRSARPLASVWTLSTTASAGAADSIAPSAVARSVVATRPRPSTTAPTRSARPRTCAADSSPVTYRTGAPAAASRAGQLQQQRALADARVAAEEHDRAGHEPAAQHPVDLADARSPGAPPRRCDLADRRDRADGARRAARSGARAGGGAGRATTVSTRVFQASQDGHWPDQRGDSAPHCWQT